MRTITRAIRTFLRDRRGQDMVEYALLAGFIAIVALVLVQGFSDPLATIYGKLLEWLNTASSLG